MEIFIVIICIIFALLAAKKEKNIINPTTIFSGLIGFSMFLASLRLYGLFELSEKTNLVVLLGVISFNLAFFLRSKVRIVRVHDHRVSQLLINECYMEENLKRTEKLFSCISLIAIVYLMIKAIYTIRSLLNGGTMALIRGSSSFSYSEESVVYSSLFDYLMSSYVISVFREASCLVGIAIFFQSSFRKKRLLILGILSVVLSMLMNGGRAVMLKFIYSFVGAYFIWRRTAERSIVSKKLKKRLIIILIIGFSAILIISNLRRENFDLLKEIYIYFGGPIPFLNVQLRLFNDQYTYGYTFVYGLIKFPEFLLHQLTGMPYSRVHGIAESIGSVLQELQVIGQNEMKPFGINAFATLFYYFYVDGGFVAVIILSFVYGSFLTNAYFKATTSPNIRSLAIYYECISAVAWSLVRYQFFMHSTVYSILLIQFLFLDTGNLRIRIKRR